MPRRGNIVKRKILPDAVYANVQVQKFINKMMWKGKKSVVEKLFYGALDMASEKIKKPQLEIFEKALNNVRPLMEVKPRRVGGATYQIPIEVPEDRGLSISMQWIRENARKRQGHSMIEKLSAELIDAYNGVGPAMKKREDTHKMAESNKAFAHFRW
jgi:small subunit ribosomal protein S7